MNLTIGDAVDWAATHRNVVNAWVTKEAAQKRMPKWQARQHRARCEAVARILDELIGSVDVMAAGQDFRPLPTPLPELREAERWLSEHVGRVQDWAGAAARNHRTQAVVLEPYDGTEDSYPRRRQLDPSEELSAGAQVVERRYGLTADEARHEVLCSRLALEIVRSVREGAERREQGGSALPEIVRRAMP